MVVILDPFVRLVFFFQPSFMDWIPSHPCSQLAHHIILSSANLTEEEKPQASIVVS